MNHNYKNILGASLLALAFSLNIPAATAQTCTTPPDCATLGFTKTAADCSGKTILKCPFNQTKVYCPGSEESSKTYAIGDTYIDRNGIPLGIVSTVDSTKMHGTLIIGGYSDTNKAEASAKCESITAGDRLWSLPASNEYGNLCDKLGLKGSFHSSGGYVYFSGCCSGCWNTSSGSQSSAGFYCSAPF